MTDIERARQRLAEIKAKYVRASEQQYLTLLIAAWEYHIGILEKAS